MHFHDSCARLIHHCKISKKNNTWLLAIIVPVCMAFYSHAVLWRFLQYEQCYSCPYHPASSIPPACKATILVAMQVWKMVRQHQCVMTSASYLLAVMTMFVANTSNTTMRPWQYLTHGGICAIFNESGMISASWCYRTTNLYENLTKCLGSGNNVTLSGHSRTVTPLGTLPRHELHLNG